MLQFYFLSILFNLLAGFVLINSEKNYLDVKLLNEKKFRLVLGILSGLAGVIKLFVVVRTDIIILGDLLPAIAGIAGGIALLIHEDNEKLPDWAKKVFVANKYLVGICCMSIAIVHFVFPGALFL